jgi:hypothetical protein
MWVILASGQSLTKEQVEFVRKAKQEGRVNGFIAVSNVGLDLAPDADALVSHDSSWWVVYPQSLEFKGWKFSARGYRGTEKYTHAEAGHKDGMNSGLMAMCVARDRFKAKKLILLGFDMHGTHYFGKHPSNLTTTNHLKFKWHIKQFEKFKGCEVINCTPNSELKIFPKAELSDTL